ncbi:MAG: GNAT family N-acetyltransferase [Sphingobacteriales bacterium]|nr:MAG: GNAT family N-acetyltransferase [Sphingobacteriales bacterium]
MTIIKIDNTQGNLVFDLFNKYRVFYKQTSDIDIARKFIQDRLDNNESVIFVAIDDSTNQAIGFTQLYPKYSSARVIKNWILNDLYVEVEYRKMGIGEKLIRHAMDFALQNGAKFVELSTAVDNFIAQRLYEQIGFKKVEPEIDFYTYRISLDL